MTLQDEEHRCEEAYATNPGNLIYAALQQLALHDNNLGHTNLLHRVECLFKKGDKNSSLLAMLVADQRAQVSVPCIRSLLGSWSRILRPVCTCLLATIPRVYPLLLPMMRQSSYPLWMRMTEPGSIVTLHLLRLGWPSTHFHCINPQNQMGS